MPFSAVNQLCGRDSSNYIDKSITYLFLNNNNRQCSTSYMMTLLKGVLHQCGIDKEFSAYSFKHAMCKYLIDSGCSEADVDEAARWKQKSKSSMVANHYAYTFTMKRIH
jgi:site-specific recombinase XerD